MSTTCGLFGTCSGNGVCVNSSVCICNSELFTGRSDWVDAEGEDCQIVLPVIWAFWALNLLEVVVVTFVAVPILRRLWRHHSRVRESQKRKGHKYTIRENLGLVSILPTWLVSMPTHVAVAILQLTERDAQLGLNVAMTVLWQLSRLATDLSMSTARAALTVSTMQSEGASPTAIWKREVSIWVVYGLSAVASFMVWPVYATQGKDLPLAQGLFASYFIISSFVSAFNAYVSHGLGVSVNASLTESYGKLKDERILQVRDALVRTQKLERNVSILIAICYLILGAVPPLWTTHDYFWCILWLLWPYVALNAVVTLDTAQRSARGEKEQNKLLVSVQDIAGGSKVRRGSVTAPTSAADLKHDLMSMWNQAVGMSMRSVRASADPEG